MIAGNDTLLGYLHMHGDSVFDYAIQGPQSAYTINGIKEVEDNNIKIFPNPGTNQLFIQANGPPVAGINIYNTTGSLAIHTTQLQNNIIDVSHLANGVYVIEITTKDASERRRWVKM